MSYKLKFGGKLLFEELEHGTAGELADEFFRFIQSVFFICYSRIANVYFPRGP